MIPTINDNGVVKLLKIIQSGDGDDDSNDDDVDYDVKPDEE